MFEITVVVLIIAVALWLGETLYQYISELGNE